MADPAPLPTPEEALRALLEQLEVNVPQYGLFAGNNERGPNEKLVLWSVIDAHYRMMLCIAGNSYQEACLNSLLGAIQQGRAALGMPELPIYVTKEPSA